jgi:NAD(P)H-dependent FMN reductase
MEHQGLLIASPEYNSGYSAALKNAIDWASRAAPGEGPLAAFSGKVAGLMAASPGALGGIRALPMVRLLLSNIGVLVIPEQASVAQVNQHISPEGQLTDERARKSVEKVGTRLAQVLAAQVAGTQAASGARQS